MYRDDIMTEYDILWNEATDLMIFLDLKYRRDSAISLDEYLSQYRESLKVDEVYEIELLLSKF